MENPPILPASESPPAVAPKSFLSSIFRNDQGGLRAGWRLALYVAIFAALWIGSTILAAPFLRPMRHPSSPGILMTGELMSFAAAFAAAWLMSGLEGRSVWSYGLPVRCAFGKLFWLGCLIGLCEVSLLMAGIAAFGGYSFGQIALHGSALVSMGTAWAVGFVLVGLFEEFLFRGYTQYTLSDGVGFWPAALVLSATFGTVHLKNPGEGWVGAASVFAAGIVFCFALKRTGNLWLCVGMHAAFDFGETFLFSVPNSGMVFERHLSSASLHGPDWLTGGTVGPEGTVFNFLTMGLVALAIHFLFPAQRKSVEQAALPGSAQ